MLANEPDGKRAQDKMKWWSKKFVGLVLGWCYSLTVQIYAHVSYHKFENTLQVSQLYVKKWNRSTHHYQTGSSSKWWWGGSASSSFERLFEHKTHSEEEQEKETFCCSEMFKKFTFVHCWIINKLKFNSIFYCYVLCLLLILLRFVRSESARKKAFCERKRSR